MQVYGLLVITVLEDYIGAFFYIPGVQISTLACCGGRIFSCQFYRATRIITVFFFQTFTWEYFTVTWEHTFDLIPSVMTTFFNLVFLEGYASIVVAMVRSSTADVSGKIFFMLEFTLSIFSFFLIRTSAKVQSSGI